MQCLNMRNVTSYVVLRNFWLSARASQGGRRRRRYRCSDCVVGCGWYRSPIDPSTLRRLMRRSDLQGALQALGHLGLFAATGILTAWFFTQAMWLPFAVALWCHGTVGTFMYIAGHDLGHGTVFRTKWLNRFFQSIFDVLSFWNPHEHDLSHIYHHRYTLNPEGDRELPGQYYDPGVVVHPRLLDITPWWV